MSKFIFDVIFRLFNPLSLIVWIAIAISFSIPWQYLGLYISILLTSYAIFSFPFNRPYIDPGHFDFLAEIMTDSATGVLFIGIFAMILIRLVKQRDHLKSFTNLKWLGIITFVVYGIFTAYYFSLFSSNFSHSYQPAYEAYLILIFCIFLIICSCLLLKKYSKHKNFIGLNNLHFLVLSFAVSMTLIIMGNLTYPVIAFKQAQKLIKKSTEKNVKYCIQSNSRELKSWLDLTPLTTWNKPNRSQSAGKRHSVLVIQKSGQYFLYHWSYRLRKWNYTSTGFKPGAFTVPSSLDCVPKQNYSETLPLFFPQSQMFFLNQIKLQVPDQYFPRKFSSHNNKNQTIQFSARLPKFTNISYIFLKLSRKFFSIANVSISHQVDANYIEKKFFASYSELQMPQDKREYGLQKKIIPQVRYQRKLKQGKLMISEEIEEHVQYYEKKRCD